MAQKLGLAVAEALPIEKARPALAPNLESAGMKLVQSALALGRIVSTKGLSRAEYIANLRARNGK